MPLFTGYLFVRLAPETSSYSLSYCSGVQGPVTFGGVLAEVEHEFVQALKAMEGDRGFILHEEIDRGLEPGCVVSISGGALEGIQGVFQGYVNGPDRARILVDFLRRRMMIEVETIRLTPVAGNL